MKHEGKKIKLAWEGRDSNPCAYDLQSLPNALLTFPIAESIGIEPRPEGLRQFSRLDGHQWPLLSNAENCGRDPQANERPDSLAGCAYPGRLALQMCGWRDSNPHNTDFKSVTFTSYITTAISSEGGIRTLKSLEPKSSAFASLTTPPNKKASQLREALESLFEKFRQYQAPRHSENNLTMRGSIELFFSWHKYTSFALTCAWAILFFCLSLNVNMKRTLQRLFKFCKALVMHRGFGCGSEGAALVHNDSGVGVRCPRMTDELQ